MTKTRSDLIQAWCEKGRRDIITAQNALLDTKEMFPDIICFHTQQAAEKYLKAYLVFLEQDLLQAALERKTGKNEYSRHGGSPCRNAKVNLCITSEAIEDILPVSSLRFSYYSK